MTNRIESLVYRCRRQTRLIKLLKDQVRRLPLCSGCMGKVRKEEPCMRCENETLVRVLTEIARDWHTNPGAYQGIAKRALKNLGKVVP